MSSYGPYVSDFSSMQGNLCCLHLVVTEGDHCQLLVFGSMLESDDCRDIEPCGADHQEGC